MKGLRILISLLFTLCSFASYAQYYGNSFPATDALGRKLPSQEEVGKPRKKYIGLFYWTWHTNFSHSDVCIPSEFIKKHPEAAYDYNHPVWRNDIPANFWGEPLFGFYRDTDKWVLRKHAEMLAAAGVDVLFFDCTNGSLTWRESYRALCETFMEARRDGVKTPQIAFMLAFGASSGARDAIVSIYEDLYKPAEYEELFFMWEGKPLIMAYPEMLPDVEGDAAKTALHREVRNYFTFRPGQPVYNVGPQRPDHWGWLEIYPQHGFAPKKDGGFEQATVGVSQNWTAHNGLSAMNMPGAFGRSYTDKEGHKEGATAQGLNFQEQWNRAFEIDPDLIFITGWNEWIMGRFPEWQKQPNAFPDQFDQEYSRDIEPMKGGHGDSYYYQMVANIRRFKGLDSAEPKPQRKSKVQIDGDFSDWEKVEHYPATRGNTLHRNSRGWSDLHYINNSGRNDIVDVKVAHDKRYVYFYVECAEVITSPDSRDWMQLYIDIDRHKPTGWEGYDYRITNYSHSAACVEHSANGWCWSEAGKAQFALNGKAMELAIPRTALSLKDGEPMAFEFKWTDNAMIEGDIYNLYLNGDVEPLGRFNYVYLSK